jgi:hypothetical protein
MKPKTPVQQCRSRNTNVSRGLASIQQKCDATKKSYETHFFILRKKNVLLFLPVSETGWCHWLLGKRRECNICGSIGMLDPEDGGITFIRDVSNHLPLDTSNIPEDFNQTQGTFTTKPVLAFLLSVCVWNNGRCMSTAIQKWSVIWRERNSVDWPTPVELSVRCPFVQQPEYCQAEPNATEHQPSRRQMSELPTHTLLQIVQSSFRNMNDAITSAHPTDVDTNHWQVARPFLYPCQSDDIRTEAEVRIYWWPTYTKCYFTARFSFLTRKERYV